MKRVVVDASALAAIVFQEDEQAEISRALEGAAVFAPTLLPFELASTARKKIRQRPADAPAILGALARALDGQWNIVWHDVRPADVVLVAHANGLSVYDATYLWLAGSLEADLVTLDARLAAAGDAWLA